MDVAPNKLLPTWRNGCAGLASVSKILDRVFIFDTWPNLVDRYRAWSIQSVVFDHIPIIFQVEMNVFAQIFPIKFNSAWLKDVDFVKLVHSLCPSFIVDGISHALFRLSSKLWMLKSIVSIWDKEMKVWNSSGMIDISLDIQNIFLQAHAGIMNREEIDVIALLEFHKQVILSNEVVAWRLKGRTI